MRAASRIQLALLIVMLIWFAHMAGHATGFYERMGWLG